MPAAVVPTGFRGQSPAGQLQPFDDIPPPPPIPSTLPVPLPEFIEPKTAAPPVVVEPGPIELETGPDLIPLPPDDLVHEAPPLPPPLVIRQPTGPIGPEEPTGSPPDFSDPGLCASCGGAYHGGPCIPGRGPCYLPEAHTFVGRVFAHLYESIACPDPCYEPGWVPEAYASFFVDYSRPQTITRLRYDYANNWSFPDRSEYFWAAAGSIRQSGDSLQFPPAFRGPKPFDRTLSPRTIAELMKRRGGLPGRGARLPGNFGPGSTLQDVLRGPLPIDVHQMYLYQEIATKRASFFMEFPYRSYYSKFYPSTSDPGGTMLMLRDARLIGHEAGFSDMNLGTKSVLLDTELLQLTFQFRTYIPIGSAEKGLGNGHVSLEPALLGTLKLAPRTYLQAQVAEWIPIGGDENYAGALIHYAFSLNQSLYTFTPTTPLIGTVEFDGYTFQDGLYSNPFFGPRNSSGGTYFNIGPGLRLSVNNLFDFGAAVTYPVTDNHFGDPYFRFEVRLIY